MKIAILGYDVEGRASFKYYASQGHQLEIRDQNSALSLPKGASSVLGDNYLDNLDQFDLLVRTAGLPPHKILDKNPTVASKITTLINEFMHASPTRNIIGVTGTKGKGTTSSLILGMLQAAGKHALLGGNIGLPPLTFLDELTADSWVVLELSSFQLIDLQTSPQIGVCLMVVPEHLNWHADMAEYVGSKKQLFAHQTSADTAIYYGQNELSQQIAAVGQGCKLPYYISPGAQVVDGAISIDGQIICHTDQLKLLGEHNWQNVCAAVTAAWQVTKDVTALHGVLTTFSGLPLRLERVRKLDGVDYYNDSFGTTPETATVALQTFNQPKIIILGGADKAADYSAMASTIASSKIRKVLLIGEQAPRIQQALQAAGFNNFMAGGDNMPTIVKTARSLAQAGDVVLLSPACTSFDMFLNYKDRGEQFTQAVQSLAATE